jgi:hypothetical protein
VQKAKENLSIAIIGGALLIFMGLVCELYGAYYEGVCTHACSPMVSQSVASGFLLGGFALGFFGFGVVAWRAIQLARRSS